MVGQSLKEVFKFPRFTSLTKGLCEVAVLEYEQALIRLLFVVIVLIYFSLVAWIVPQAEGFNNARLLAGFYGAVSILILLSFRYLKKGSLARRTFTLLSDHGMTCFAMYFAGEMGVPLSIVLFWITVGYGARFGEKYLFAGMLLSSVGLLALTHSAIFWVDHPVIGYSLTAANVIVPLFVSTILRQLFAARAMAEDASRAKSHFLANISHEMRTPLSCIIGISQLLLSETKEPDSPQKLKSIDLSARHLLNLIDDILDISRIEAGQLRIEHQSFNLHQLLSDTCTSFDPIAQKKGLDLVFSIAPEVPEILKGDPLRIQQILNNLTLSAKEG